MKNLSYIFFAALCCSLLGFHCNRSDDVLQEQGTAVEFLRYYHIADEAVEMVETDDGGIVILGNGVDGKGFTHLTLFKVTGDGEFLWEKSIEEEYYSWIGNDLVLTAEGGFAIASSRWDANGEGDATLLKLNAFGDTLWSREKLREEVDTAAYQILDDSIFYIDSKGVSVAETSTGDLLFLLEAYSRKEGLGAVIDVYDAEGDSTDPSTETYGFGIRPLEIHSQAGQVSVFFSWDLFGERQLGITTRDESTGLDFSDVLIESQSFYTPPDSFDSDNTYAGGSIIHSNSGDIFAIGTSTFLNDNRPHLYAIKTNPEGDRLWEYLDATNDRSWGFHIAATPEGGAVAVGAQQTGSNQDLYIVELAPDPVGLDTVNYDGDPSGIAAPIRSFTYGSDLDPETARSIIVTHDGKWLILGDHTYFGQGGIWLLKIDPDKL